MAGFKTHITVSSVIGIGYGAAAYGWYQVPPTTSALAAALCGVSGMLPDLDSGPGVPLRESCAFAAAVVPMLLLERFEQCGMDHELIVLAGAALYFLIRFGLAWLLRLLTEHRGMFHSIPTALIFGEIAFLLVSGSDVRLRLIKAGAVVTGFLSHLLLDELYSIEWSRGFSFKSSFGTAMKVFGHQWLPNVFTFLVLGALTYVSLNEPTWMKNRMYQSAEPSVAQSPDSSGQATDRNVSQKKNQTLENWFR